MARLETKLADADKKLVNAETIRDEIVKESQQVRDLALTQKNSFNEQIQQQKNHFDQQIKELKNASSEAIHNAEKSSHKFATELQSENEEYKKELNQTIKQIRKVSKSTSPVPIILSGLALLISIATAVLLLTGVLPLKNKNEVSPTPTLSSVTAEPEKVTVTEEPTVIPTETPTAEPTEEPTPEPDMESKEDTDEEMDAFIPDSIFVDYADGKGEILESLPDELSEYTEWIGYPSYDKLLIQTEQGYIVMSKEEMPSGDALFRTESDGDLYRIDSEKGVYTVSSSSEESIYIYLITKSLEDTEVIAKDWNLFE